MSETILGVYTANPVTTNQSLDLIYFGRSPYGTSNDVAMTYANFAAQFASPLPTGNSGIFYTSSAGAVSLTAPLTNGQLLIGSTGANPVVGTLTAGTGTTVVNAAGSITINATGGGMTWTVVTGTSSAMVPDIGYVSNNAGLVTFTLPVTAAVGTQLGVGGFGAGGWKVAQNAGQIIHLGSQVTTTGAGGSLASSNQYDSLVMLCVVANTTWIVLSGPEGNITVV